MGKVRTRARPCASGDRLRQTVATTVLLFPALHRRFSPGWIDGVCPDEEATDWLRQAILTENVTTRREGATLSLPAGEDFRPEEEIRNVVTAVARTYHSRTAHAAAWQGNRRHDRIEDDPGSGLPATKVPNAAVTQTLSPTVRHRPSSPRDPLPYPEPNFSRS